MMHRAFLAALAILTAHPIWALSCLQPDIVQSYIQARDSEDLYSMVIGTLQADGPVAIPKRDTQGNYPNGTTADTALRLTGRGLTGSGFSAPFNDEITLRVSCISAWCGGPPAMGTQVFAVLRHSGGDLLLEVSPCPSNALAWSADDEARVLNCHRFDKCAGPE